MSTRLSKRPERLFIDVLLADWDPTGAVGYDVTAGEGTDAFLPVATSIDNVGAVYPSLVITYSNETSGGETTYDFLSAAGPGQNRTGQLVATARAEDRADGGYTGDSSSFGAVDAATVVDEIIAEVEDVCLRNDGGGSTDFSYLGSQRGPDVPDDDSDPPVTRIEDCVVAYGWTRTQ